MKRNISVLRLLVPLFLLTSCLFVFKALFANPKQVLVAVQSVDLGTIIFSMALFSVYFYCRVVSWGFVMQALHKKMSVRNVSSIWFLGEFARYIPGNVWSFASRTYLAQKAGVPKKVTLTTMGIEALMLVVAAGIISVPYLLAVGTTVGKTSPVWILPIVLVGGLLLLAVPKLRHKLNPYIATLKQNKRLFLFAFLTQCFGWLAFGGATAVLAYALPIPFFVMVSIAVCAWLVGYVSFITPMGLGVREGAMVVFLSGYTDVSTAALFALLSRVVLIVTELINVLLWGYVSQKQKLIAALTWTRSHWEYPLLAVGMVTYAVTFIWLSILRHTAFASNYDLGNMDQTLWNTLHGNFFALTVGEQTVSRFAVHGDLLLIFLAPLYFIWEDVRMLIGFESIALSLGAIPTYLLALTVLKRKSIALIMAAVYLLNPAMQWTDINDFHPVAIAIPLLIGAFYFAYIKSWRWFFVCIGFALLTKEQISLYVFMLGLFIAYVYKEKRIGLITAMIGLVWFCIMAFIMIPLFNPFHGKHWVFDWYQSGNSGSGSLVALAKNEIARFFSYHNYYVSLLRPFGFLPLIGLPLLFFSLPELAINILSSHEGMKTIYLHYASGIIPSLVIATIFGLSTVEHVLGRYVLTRRYATVGLMFVAGWLLVYAMWINYLDSPLPFNPNCRCIVYRPTSDDKAFAATLASLPPDATITTSPEIRPHITHRQHAFSLPDATQSAQYIAIINQNRLYGDYQPKYYERFLINDLMQSSRYRLVSHVSNFYLFENLIPKPY